MAEVRKIGAQDLQIGEGTVESPGGVTVQEIDARHIPVAYGTANDAVTGYSDIVFSVDDALSSKVDVRAYGAVGDGVTDDKAAIQSAIDAASGAGGGVVFFPSGTFLISSSLASKRSVRLVGSGREATVIYNSGTGVAIDIDGTSSSTAYFEVSDLWIKGNPSSSHGIEINQAQHVLLKRLRIGDATTTYAPDIGIRLLGYPMYSVSIEDTVIYGTRGENIRFENNALTRADFNLIHVTCGDADINGNGTAYNIYLDSVSNFHAMGLVVENSATVQSAGGIVFANTINSAVIEGLYYEDRQSTRKNTIDALSASSLTILGAYSDGHDYFLQTATNGVNNGIISGVRTISSQTGTVDSTLATDKFILLGNRFDIDPTFSTPRGIWQLDTNFLSGYVGESGTEEGGIKLYIDGILGLYLSGYGGISGTSTKARNLRGQETLSSGTATVTFTTEEDDNSYYIFLSGDAGEAFSWASKATTGFTINSDSGASTATVDWFIIR
jgi:hypothetical protein